jgi:pantoate--beta-alanine ligase
VKIIATVGELRAACDTARAAGKSVGLVPTMGFLHAGHRSLMGAARADTDFVVVTLFVNPTQFGPNEDLAGYPRDLGRDADVCRAEGVDVLFTPTVDQMYPTGARTTVHVAELTDRLCGASRPGHFDGVTTIVAKLFSIVGANHAFFGKKDAQQLAVVTRMAADLNLPVVVIGCSIVREPDGLALSSRNAYLTATERAAALVLSRSLRAAMASIEAGQRDASFVRDELETAIASESLGQLDYAEIVDGADLQPISRIAGSVLIAVAAQFGRARLIDNVALVVSPTGITADLGVIPAVEATPT